MNFGRSIALGIRLPGLNGGIVEKLSTLLLDENGLLTLPYLSLAFRSEWARRRT